MLAPVGPGAFVPLKLAIASADSVGNDVYVAVVVDFGSGSSMSSVSKCVPVASNAHDSDALAAAVGAGNVAYNNSGLLCSIDNYPVNGVQNCGAGVGSGNFDYWSYWHGSSGSWVYANDGPAEHSVASQSNDVEGWRFQVDQPDNSSDPAPGIVPSYAQICNASTEVPPAQTPPAATPTTTATATPKPPSAVPTTGRTGTGPALATTPTTAAGTRPKSDVPTKKAATGATKTTTTPGSGDTASGGGNDGSAQGSSSTHRSIAASAASSDSGGGASSNVLPVILIAAVVAALGGLALLRWRRRPAEE